MNAILPGEGLLSIEASIAVRVARWITYCGGVAVWKSLDATLPIREYLTPAHRTDGSPPSQPHWSVADAPDRIVTDIADVEVVERREFQRVRIAIRKGYGLGLVLTNAASKRLEAVLEQAGEGAIHFFDGNNAIVFAVARRVSLRQWMEEHPHAKAV